MKKQIVIINGSGGVGKDTFVNFCNIYAKSLNVSSVDMVKQAAELLGWKGGKSEKDRSFLCDLKLIASDYNDHSYKYIKEKIKFFKEYDPYSKILFIHVREPKEICRIKKEFGCRTLLITNNNIKDISSNMADSNVYIYKYDFIIDNDGSLNDLREKANKFVVELFK